MKRPQDSKKMNFQNKTSFRFFPLKTKIFTRIPLFEDFTFFIRRSSTVKRNRA